MKNLTWQNPEQFFVAQELINKVKSKCCGIKGENFDWGFNGKIGVEFSQIQLFCGYELGMKEVWIWPENAKNRSIVFGVGYIF